MEMWCPDGMKRESWDWVGPPSWKSFPEWCGGSSPERTEPPQIVWLLLLLLMLVFGVVVAVLLVLSCVVVVVVVVVSDTFDETHVYVHSMSRQAEWQREPSMTNNCCP